MRLRRAAPRKGSAFPKRSPPLFFRLRLHLAGRKRNGKMVKKGKRGIAWKGGAFPQSSAAEPLADPSWGESQANSASAEPLASPSSGPPPNDLVQIHQQGFVFPRPPAPATCARPSIILGTLGQSRSYRALMNIVHPLHEEAFAKKR